MFLLIYFIKNVTIADMKKPANRTNLVRGHLSGKMWTFCPNSNNYTTTHIFLEQIDHIEGRISKSVAICYKFIHFGLVLHQHSHKLAIYSRKKCGQFKPGIFGLRTFLDFFHVCFNSQLIFTRTFHHTWLTISRLSIFNSRFRYYTRTFCHTQFRLYNLFAWLLQ